MSKPWIFVSPASRGIGRALTQHLLRTTTLPILATARSADTSSIKSNILDSLHDDDAQTRAGGGGQGRGPKLDPDSLASRLHIAHLDFMSEPSVSSAADHARALFPPETHHLHLGFSLPGVLLRPEKNPAQIRYDDALETMRMNVLGPMLLMKWFSEFLPRKATAAVAELDTAASEEKGQGQGQQLLRLPAHATWLNMSARVGSVSDNRLGGWFAYRASKSAVNSLTRTLDNHLRTRSGDRALAMAYHPGTVKTDLSRDFWSGVKPEKLFTPEYAVERMAEVVASRELGHRGRCWDWKGDEVLP